MPKITCLQAKNTWFSKAKSHFNHFIKIFYNLFFNRGTSALQAPLKTAMYMYVAQHMHSCMRTNRGGWHASKMEGFTITKM